MPHATGEVGSQNMLVLAQGFPSEEALSRNFFFLTTELISTAAVTVSLQSATAAAVHHRAIFRDSRKEEKRKVCALPPIVPNWYSFSAIIIMIQVSSQSRILLGQCHADNILRSEGRRFGFKTYTANCDLCVCIPGVEDTRCRGGWLPQRHSMGDPSHSQGAGHSPAGSRGT
jgi:hypothetical protein